MVLLSLSHVRLLDMRKHDIDTADIAAEVPSVARGCTSLRLIGKLVEAARTTFVQIISIHITTVLSTRPPTIAGSRSTDGGIDKHFITGPHKRLEIVVRLEGVFLRQVRYRIFLQEAVITSCKSQAGQ